MKHVPWPVLVAEFICWGILLVIPFFVLFVDMQTEIMVLLIALWIQSGVNGVS